MAKSDWVSSAWFKDWERVPVEQYTEEQLSKKHYVDDILSPALREADIGWFATRYEIVKGDVANREIVHICDRQEACRTIIVDAMSKCFIAEAVFKNVIW